MSSPMTTNFLNALTVKQLEGLEKEGIKKENIIYQAHVSAIDWKAQLMQDIPYTYIVVEDDHADGGCIIYGWSDRGWYANPTLRWLVKHLIAKNMEVQTQC